MPEGRPRRAENVLFQFFRTQQSLRQLMSHVFEGTGVTGDEYGVLGVIALVGPLPPSEVAARTGMPPTTISRYAANFAERGLVARVPNPADRRSYLLEITAPGRAVVETILPRLRRTLRALDEQPGTAISEILEALAQLEEKARRVLEGGELTTTR